MANQVATQPLIKATTFNRVSSKDGVFLGYVVKSDSTENYYHLTFDGAHWHCDCPARVLCKHIKALNEHLKARREMKAQQPQLTPAATLVGYDVIGAALAIVNNARNQAVAGDAYEMIAAMHAAVQSVPSFVERFRDERPGCEHCGGRHQSWNCPL